MWFKNYIDLITELQRTSKTDFEIDFCMIKNNFGLAIENIQKHRNIRLVSDDKRRNCLLSKPNYYSTKSFPKLCRNGVSYVKLWKYWKTVTNGKETGFMKDGLRGEIMKEFSRLKPKTYSYIKDNNK